MRKVTLTISSILITFYCFSQTTTQDGDWITGATWGGSSPGYTGLNTPTINHDVESDATLNFSTGNNNQGGIMNINHTLVVRGDIIFNANENKGQIFVGSGATLIIFGDLDMGKNNAGITVAAGGVVVVTGTIEDKNGGEISGDGKVYTNNPTDLDDSGIGENAVQPIDNLDGDGYEDIEAFVNEGGASPLPVELLDFKATNNSSVKLSWATATEINNDYFSVERSEDGEHFYEIGNVSGNGNSNEIIEYSFEDKFVLEAVEYYRLKQVDYNGEYEYFSAIRVETDVFNSKAQFTIYPNVVENQQLNIASNSPFELKELTIFNLNGSSIINLVGNAEKLNQVSYQINTSDIEGGIYVLDMISTSGSRKSTRLIIK